MNYFLQEFLDLDNQKSFFNFILRRILTQYLKVLQFLLIFGG